MVRIFTKTTLVLTMLVMARAGFSQQLPLFGNYSFHGFLLNPAMTGWDDRMALNATFRQQWTAMPDAPRTATLSFSNYDTYYKMGYGGGLLYDQTGPTSMVGALGMYAYHLNFDNQIRTRRLAFGISASILQYRLKGSELYLHDAIDQLVFDNTRSKIVPDFSVGAFYYDDVWYGGISVQQLLGMNVKIKDAAEVSNLKRAQHIYAVAGGKFYTRNNINYFEPSIWIKYAHASPPNVTINARYHYDNVLTAGVGFSSDLTAFIEASVLIKEKFRIGYAFSSQFSTLSQYLGTNHEILLSYIIRTNDEYF